LLVQAEIKKREVGISFVGTAVSSQVVEYATDYIVHEPGNATAIKTSLQIVTGVEVTIGNYFPEAG